MTPKVTVIAWVDNSTYDQVRYLVESFQRQVYPHKELLVANRADWHPIRNLPGRQIKLPWDTNTATTMSELVRLAQGEYCVVWKPGYWYHPHVLSMHMGYTDPYTETLIQLLEGVTLSQGFYRRAYHLVTSNRSKLVNIGGVGLVKRIGEEELAGTRYFYHSGNLGDIIYALPAMKALGGGFLLIGPDIHLKTKEPILFREDMNPRLFNTVAPLLRAQPYVTETYFYNFMPKVNYDMNRFRTVEWTGQNLAEMTMQGLGLEGKFFLNHFDPWLRVPDAVFGKPVVIHRSSRYHNLQFPWRRVLTKYYDQIEFVGFQSEHAAFCKEFGADIPFYQARDLLDLARRIAGATLFIGNQSCPCAIAEGLKVNIVQETDAKIANCKFDRSNVIYCADEHLYLPELGSLKAPQPPKKRWTFFWRKPKAQDKTFYHSGDLGDIIYALPAIKELGGGHVVLGPIMDDVRAAVKPRAVLNQPTYGLIEPLIKRQSYVKSVRFENSMPEGAVDLNHFRHVEWQRANGFKYKSIPEMVREAVGLQSEFDTVTPWLEITDPLTVADVVIHRSTRFHGDTFPWKEVVAKYGASAVFVGLKDEHRDFTTRFGWIPYLPTTDLNVLARVIAGATLFVGNQSSPYAIAEGIKKATVQEMSTDCPNCVFTRSDAVFGSDEFTPLPDIKFAFADNTEAWNDELVSFFTTCKNRVEHVKQTLPKNLEHHKDDPNVEFVLLDYSSGDGLAEWIKEEMTAYLESGKLVYFRANGYPKFQMSHAKNCAARLTRGAILCNMDSDNETGKSFAEWLRRAVKDGRWAGTESFTDDFGGRQAFRRRDFYALGGFDEQMIGWGSDDYDMSKRAAILGLKCVEIPAIYKYSLSHSNELRGKFMEVTDRDATNRMNLERAHKNHAAKLTRVNPGRWGVILVERNFDGQLTAI